MVMLYISKFKAMFGTLCHYIYNIIFPFPLAYFE